MCLPDRTVLCRVEEASNPHLTVITSYDGDAELPFYSSYSGTGYKTAKPLTNEEIEAFKIP